MKRYVAWSLPSARSAFAFLEATALWLPGHGQGATTIGTLTDRAQQFIKFGRGGIMGMTIDSLTGKPHELAPVVGPDRRETTKSWDRFTQAILVVYARHGTRRALRHDSGLV